MQGPDSQKQLASACKCWMPFLVMYDLWLTISANECEHETSWTTVCIVENTTLFSSPQSEYQTTSNRIHVDTSILTSIIYHSNRRKTSELRAFWRTHSHVILRPGQSANLPNTGGLELRHPIGSMHSTVWAGICNDMYVLSFDLKIGPM